MDRRRTAAPDRKKKSRHHEVDVSSGTQLFSRSTWEEGLKERDIWNVTFDFSPEHGDDEDANRDAVVEKRKTCGAKEFGPSQRSAGSLAGVHRHDPVTVNWKQRGAPTRDSPSQRRHRQKKKPSRSAATRRRRRKTPAAASRKEPRPRAERQVPRSRTGTKNSRAKADTPRCRNYFRRGGPAALDFGPALDVTRGGARGARAAPRPLLLLVTCCGAAAGARAPAHVQRPWRHSTPFVCRALTSRQPTQESGASVLGR